MLTQPDIRPYAWRKYELASAWSVEWEGATYSIPEGFRHDGASVPRPVWSLTGLRPDGLLRAAALLHDALYRHGGRLPKGWGPQVPISRKDADRAFYGLMIEAGVPRWRAWTAWRAVRVFGRWSWKRS